MQKLILLFFIFSVSVAAAQSKNEKKIREILNEQTGAWNRGDIAAFMSGYWQHDSLMFIGKTGIVYGWQQTLENYHDGVHGIDQRRDRGGSRGKRHGHRL